MKKMSALEAYPSDDLMGEKEQYSYPEVSNIVYASFIFAQTKEDLVKFNGR